MKSRICRTLTIPLCAMLCSTFSGIAQDQPAAGQWISLFNGKDLTGWTPKFRGCDLGENFNNTYRVEDGVIKVRYDKYGKFDNRFGHLFYATPFSNYLIRFEYRFVSEQCPGGPGWAIRNSGVMIHCQPPATMRREQEFPVSVEVQVLGGNGRDARTTGNVCTPGTLISRGGKVITAHCIDSTSKTFHGDQWVTLEVAVHGGDAITNKINGTPVFTFEKPELDPGDADASKMIAERGGKTVLRGGYISLQAESHPCEFRKIDLLPLE
jgi:hypothetical protein